MRITSKQKRCCLWWSAAFRLLLQEILRSCSFDAWNKRHMLTVLRQWHPQYSQIVFYYNLNPQIKKSKNGAVSVVSIDSARLLSTAYPWVHPYVLLLKTKTICLTCQTALTCWGMDRGPHWVLWCCHITILRLWRLENLSSYVSWAIHEEFVRHSASQQGVQ